MKYSEFFNMLKTSPLVEDINASCVEKAAIWLEVNGLATAKGIKQILDTCSKMAFTTEDFMTRAFLSTSVKQLSTRHSQCLYATQLIFKSVFFILFTTNCLDLECFNRKFIDAMVKKRDKFSHKSMYEDKHIPGVKRVNHTAQMLYEVFAELVERLEDKRKLLVK